MPTFTPDERLELARLAKELKTYGLTQYMERRQREVAHDLLKVRFFLGELTDTEYWLHHTAMFQGSLRQYAQFHDKSIRLEHYYGELTIDNLRAATEGFDIDVADLQPADDQAGLYLVSPLVE